MKNILVLGGAGYIGSHLIEELIIQNKGNVFSLDNYSSGSKQNHIEGCEYIEGEAFEVSNLIKHEINIVFHLGEYSRVERSFQDIDKVWERNICSFFPVLEFCRKNKTKIIYSGSSTKFSLGEVGKDMSPYAWSKSTNTDFLKNYSKWFGLDYAITYFYNTYGGRENFEGDFATVIGIFSDQYRKSEPLTVVSPGTQKRFFTHVDDIISALILISEHGYGDGYGIGSEDQHSIIEVAKMFDSQVKMVPARKGNREDSELVTKKTKELGWTAKKTLREHINKIKGE
ncbi:MAG: NAD-dependent epimerase/dehydratase family protein [SAR86 cluster bacterium]|nr:NAD-dependent epimerase/dehydratase family protein [SAR86 cluster bacterium]